MKKQLFNLKEKTIALVKEPLFYFFSLGIFLFIVMPKEQLVENNEGKKEEAPASRVIHVSNSVIADLKQGFQIAYQREPSMEELNALIADYQEEAVLFSEGVKNNLHQNDPLIRKRVVEKMRLLSRQTLTQDSLNPPSDQELLSWYRHNKLDDLSNPKIVSFYQAAIGQRLATQTQARDLANELNERETVESVIRGQDSEIEVNDQSVTVRFFNQRYAEALGVKYGSHFVNELLVQGARGWQALASEKGWLVVKLENVLKDEKGKNQKDQFAEEKEKIKEKWFAAQEEKALAEKLEALKAQYQFRVGVR